MRSLSIAVALICTLALTGCAAQGVVEHDGAELTPQEHASLYQSREEEHPDPVLTEKRTVYYTESGTKFKVSPMIKRISESIWNRFSPLLEFFPIIGITGDITFINSICPEGTPLIVVSTKPQFSYAAETIVFSYHLR